MRFGRGGQAGIILATASARAERFNAVGGESARRLRIARAPAPHGAAAPGHQGSCEGPCWHGSAASPKSWARPLPGWAEIKGLGETSITHLKVLQAVAQRAQRDRIARDQPILSSWSQLIDYCHAQMAFEAVEQFRILFSTRRTG